MQADCFSHRPGPFESPTATASYLELRLCSHFFESKAELGYHECSIAPFPSINACIMETGAYLHDSIRAATDAGLHYAEDCLERSDALGGPPDLASGTWLDCENDCQFFHGDQPEGTPCESFGHRMSDCAQGLVCAPDGICHRPCDYSFTAPEGGFCGPTRGMWFVTCDTGLACGGEGTCEPAAILGSACDAATPCAVEGWCDPDTSSCVARLAAESPCEEHEQCVTDLCIDGICVEPEWPECGRWGW